MDNKHVLSDDKKREYEDALAHSLEFIFWGLATLEHYRIRTHSPNISLLLLSFGLERFLKCILTLEAFLRTSQFLTKAELIKKGHKLEHLIQDVIQKLPIQVELREILQDSDIKKFYSLLDSYNQRDRYYYLNKLCSGSSCNDKFNSPADELERIQDDIWWSILPKEKYGKVLSGEAEFQPIWEEMIKKIERLIRGLCQLFTSGALGSLGIEYKDIVDHFADMQDNELGSTSYADLLFPNQR